MVQGLLDGVDSWLSAAGRNYSCQCARLSVARWKAILFRTRRLCGNQRRHFIMSDPDLPLLADGLKDKDFSVWGVQPTT